jgi:hypothetical protein
MSIVKQMLLDAKIAADYAVAMERTAILDEMAKEQSTSVRYVGDYVAFNEFGKIKITTRANYDAFIRNASMVMSFDGTIQEAVEYIEHYMVGEN